MKNKQGTAVQQTIRKLLYYLTVRFEPKFWQTRQALTNFAVSFCFLVTFRSVLISRTSGAMHHVLSTLYSCDVGQFMKWKLATLSHISVMLHPFQPFRHCNPRVALAVQWALFVVVSIRHKSNVIGERTSPVTTLGDFASETIKQHFLSPTKQYRTTQPQSAVLLQHVIPSPYSKTTIPFISILRLTTIISKGLFPHSVLYQFPYSVDPRKKKLTFFRMFFIKT